MAYGFTYTLPTITGSHTDFPVVLKTADFPTAAKDGGANSLLNGGGDLRAYTDSTKTIQLPLDVVTFVVGGTPDIEVHAKIPTAATGNTIYLEADSVATVQPAVTNAYGRDAAWSEAELAVLMEDATPVDRSGNHTLTLAGTLTPTDGPFGGALAFGTDSRISSLDATLRDILTTHNTTVDMVTRKSSPVNNSAALSWEGSDDFALYAFENDGTPTLGVRAFWRDISDINTMYINNVVAANIWEWTSFTTRANNSHELYQNGVSGSVKSGTGSVGPFTGFYIGGLGNTDQNLNGDIAQVVVWKTRRTGDWIETGHANQSTAVAWGTVGTWADSGGGTTHNTLALSSQINASLTASAVQQVHQLAAAGSRLDALSLSGAVAQVHQTAAVSSLQLSSVTAAAVAQVHLLAALSSDIQVKSSLGALASGLMLAAASSEVVAQSTRAALVQTHQLLGVDSRVDSQSLAAALQQVQQLGGRHSELASQSSVGALAAGLILAAAQSAINSQSSSAPMQQVHVLAALQSVIESETSVGRWLSSVVPDFDHIILTSKTPKIAIQSITVRISVKSR